MDDKIRQLSTLVSILNEKGRELAQEEDRLMEKLLSSYKILKQIDTDISDNRKVLSDSFSGAAEGAERYRLASDYIKVLFSKRHSEINQYMDIKKQLQELGEKKTTLKVEAKGYEFLTDNYTQEAADIERKKEEKELDDIWLLKGVVYE